MNATKTGSGMLMLVLAVLVSAPAGARLSVVTSLPEYAWAARAIGGDHVQVEALLPPDQDAHTLTPRPSYAVKVGRADLFVATGLDLETWVPALLRKAGNRRVRPGAPGYVKAAEGVHLLDTPRSADRSQGDVHVYGNPHIHTSPVNMRVVVRNIAAGLSRVDPERAAAYAKASARVVLDLDERLFGAELVRLLGGDLAAKLASKGKLIDFLTQRKYRGKPLIAFLGGWMGGLRAVRGRTIVTYHANWAYLARLFGVDIGGVAEAKPGIPPSATHVASLVAAVQKRGVLVLLAARHYPAGRVHAVAKKAGVAPVTVPFHVGSGGTTTYPELVDRWVAALRRAGP